MPRGPGFAAQVRRDILKHRKKVLMGRGKVTDAPAPVRDPGKTLAMHLLEQQHGKPIEELIATGEIKDIGRALGIDPTTVSLWRKKLGLRE